MNQPFETWQKLFDDQESLLTRLASSLDAERHAVSDRDVVSLKEAVQAKSAVSRDIAVSCARMEEFRKGEAERLTGNPETPMGAVLRAYDDDARRPLEDRRLRLKRLSNGIQRSNDLNGRWLKANLDHVRVLRSILGIAGEGTGTYTAEGATAEINPGGRLVNRSF